MKQARELDDHSTTDTAVLDRAVEDGEALEADSGSGRLLHRIGWVLLAGAIAAAALLLLGP